MAIFHNPNDKSERHACQKSPWIGSHKIAVCHDVELSFSLDYTHGDTLRGIFLEAFEWLNDYNTFEQ